MTSFGDAFKAARTAGKTTFKWQGKSYHTKTKEEMEKTKKTYSVPTPAPRPSNETASGAELPTSKPTSTATATMFRQAAESSSSSRIPSLVISAKREAAKEAQATSDSPEKKRSQGYSTAIGQRQAKPYEWPKPMRSRAWANK